MKHCFRVSSKLILGTSGLLLLALTGCTLDRSGGCGEGEIVCTVFKKEYSFTTDDNDYTFEGRCEIKNDGGSTLGAPMVPFKVRGTYDRHTLEFKEIVEVTGEGGTDWAITGFCYTDPWLNPYAPVGVTNYSGNPQAFAQQLCISQMPPEYAHIPFSRNVIIHMLSLQDRLALIVQAANPEASTPPPPPPAPPCPPSWLTGPPEMEMPKDNLVYKENVQGVTVYLKSRCGADNIDYSDSFYNVIFEHYEGNSWQEFKFYKIPMEYYWGGGSIGSDTLALGGPGRWRVHARHVTTQKNSAAAVVGAWGDWVEFWIGQPQVELSNIDLSVLKKVQFSSLDYQKLEDAWNAAMNKKTVKPMFSSGAGKVESEDKDTKRGATQPEPGVVHPPEPGKMQPGASAKTVLGTAPVGSTALTTRRTLLGTNKIGPKLTVRDVNPTNTLELIAGKSVNLVFALSNSGDEASDRTPYSLSCKVVGDGARCPFDDKRGVLAPIPAKNSGEIQFKGLRFPAGDFELTLKLANVTGKTLKLRVAAAVTPGAVKRAPKVQLNRDNEPIRQQQAPLRRIQ